MFVNATIPLIFASIRAACGLAQRRTSTNLPIRYKTDSRQGDGMRIPGISNDELVRTHWNSGRGNGAAMEYKHLPTGISVYRRYGPHDLTAKIHDELLAELAEKLRAVGLIPGTDTPSQGQ
jgi:hypothetical protein